MGQTGQIKRLFFFFFFGNSCLFYTVSAMQLCLEKCVCLNHMVTKKYADVVFWSYMFIIDRK